MHNYVLDQHFLPVGCTEKFVQSETKKEQHAEGRQIRWSRTLQVCVVDQTTM